MPTPGLIFSVGSATIELDQLGRVLDLEHRRRPELGYLTGFGAVVVDVDGVRAELPVTTTAVDSDEFEVVRESPALRLAVRHSLAAGWGCRIAFTNLAAHSVAIEACLPFEPGERLRTWGLAAGAEASLALLPADGAGPLLGGTLTGGSLVSFDQSGLRLERIELAPAGRYVLGWTWDWYLDARSFGRGRHPEVPVSQWVLVDEPVRIRADPDVAVLAPELAGESESDSAHLDLIPVTAGEHRVDLRSANGTVSFAVHAAEPADHLLAELAGRLLTGPRTGADVVRLDDARQGLVLQRALTDTAVTDSEQANDALDLLTARLRDATGLDPFAAAYLCDRAIADGDADLVATAAAALRAASRPRPGAGLATLRFGAASMVVGYDPRGTLAELARLLPVDPAPSPSAEPDLPGLLAELELLLVLAPADADAAADAAVAARLARIGAWRGGGLKGGPPVPAALPDLAAFAVVSELLPERHTAEFRRRWLCSPQELARRARAEVLARCVVVGGHPVTDAVWSAAAWLALTAAAP